MPAGPFRLVVVFCASALLIAQDAQLTRLHADLDFLTSDVLAGRVSLSPQAEIAARFIDAEFRKAGLTSQLQAFPVVGYRSDPKQRQLLLTRGGASRPLHAFTGGFYRDIAVRAPVVFAGYGITALEYAYDDYATVNASGRIVLIFDHEPQEDSAASVFNGTGHTLHAGRAAKVLNARRHGALAVLIATEPSHHSYILASPQRAPLRASAPPQAIDDPAQIPAFTLSEADVKDLLSVTGRTPVELQDAIDASLRPQSQPLRDTEVEIRASNAEQHRGSSLNAIGLLEGSDPELKSETILISAHYDHLGVQNEHLYPGANDNASGTAAVMELARLLAKEPRPRRSILFAVFGSEEQLMLGSFYYTAHPLRSLATTRAVLNLDMIARDDIEGASNRIHLVGTYYSRELLAAIRAQNRKTGLDLSTELDADQALNVLFRCDHLPFLLSGLPAVWFFGGFHPGYHEPSDVVEKLNLPKLQNVIRLAHDSAVALADTSAPPQFGIPK
uniref:Peptidase M28 n=1 Tax=Solibacter usitatus (strain Ellin6076) TaxID=234267 RepID=Q01TI2_SOLUE